MQADHLSNQDWNRIGLMLNEQFRFLPSSAKFVPCYNATSWDCDDLYRAAREDAIRSRSIVWQLVEDKLAAGAWPRGQYEAKFWLRARWDGAISYALELEGAARGLASQSRPTKDDRKTTRWLLFEMWDGPIVDRWLAEHLEDYTYYENYGLDPDSYADYSKWLDRLRAGHYIRK
jgi:hypothetical protein